MIPRLKAEEHYTIDEKIRTGADRGGHEARRAPARPREPLRPANIELLHHVNQALRAHSLFKRDVDYVVKDGEVLIVDEFTGRLMPGRRWTDGLHQAVEAKEIVRSKTRTRRSRPSPSRTTSACTRSSRA